MAYMKLPGFLFLYCVSVTAYADKQTSCRASNWWADDLDAEQQGIKLLQAKGSKVGIDQETAHLDQPSLLEELLQDSKHVTEQISTSKCHVQMRNTDCGWGAQCQADNQAFVNDGARSKEGIERDAALRLCGPICNNAGDSCGGFSWTDGTCWFRKSSLCGVIARKGTDCYQKGHEVEPIPGQGLP